MKKKKLFLIIALVVICAVGAHAQKTVFKFRDASSDVCLCFLRRLVILEH